MTPVERVPNRFGEDIRRAVLPSGLTVMLNPKEGFCRTVGVVATHFGSLDCEVPEESGPVRIPDGVAHFLEHKLFEDEEGDVSLRFSSRGANSNAATEYTKTSYHFSCVDLVEENVETLLRFVLHPYFTTESVKKEQGIIEQEIRMYDDDPDWVVYLSLMQSLYHRHPVRINIAGSIQSIREISPEVLYRCHRFFYHPDNLILAVSGGFDAATVLARIEGVTRDLAVGTGRRHRRAPIDEPEAVLRQRSVQKFAVSRPQVCIGFKDSLPSGSTMDQMRRDFETQMLLDLLFSTSSEYHRELYEAGVIDDSFDAAHSSEAEYSFSVIGAESDDPDRFVAAVTEVIQRARDEGLDPDGFLRVRNRLLGRFLRGFNSPESVAGALINCEFRGVSLDAMLSLMDSISLADLTRRLRDHLDVDRSAVSILLPSDSSRSS